MIKPVYLLADSQLLFLRDDGKGLPDRIRAELPSSGARAAYIGASNDDRPEFYDLFVAAMQLMGIDRCRMVPTRIADEDRAFLEAADLVLLAGGDVERGWRVFEQNRLQELIIRKRYEGSILVGVSAGAIHLGLGVLSEEPQPKKIELLGFAPFYVSAHQEQLGWWELRALVSLSQSDARGIGIPSGGGAVYWPDGSLEPIRRPLTEMLKKGDQVEERLLLPMPPSEAD